MTTSEHLQRIKAKCESLLELASKRTPGKWEVKYKRRDTGAYTSGTTYTPFVKSGVHTVAEGWESDEKDAEDLDFCASCAGPAEAGWRATIAAIDDLEEIHESTPLGEYAAWDALNKILAAWPEEIL